MVTIEEFKNCKLRCLRNIFHRPGMYAYVDHYMMDWLSDLLFIDQRGSLLPETDRLTQRGRFRSTGTAGAFTCLFPKLEDADLARFSNESASIWAEVAFRLGYLQLERALSPREWEAIQKNLENFRRNSWHRKDVIELLGQPSFIIGEAVNPAECCFCYATDNPDTSWYYFDFAFSPDGYTNVVYSKRANPFFPKIDGFETHEHPDWHNPLLRDVRTPADDFCQSVILTPYGRRCWGRPRRITYTLKPVMKQRKPTM